jgi:uncharacterized LabA/DUF88 family protein
MAERVIVFIDGSNFYHGLKRNCSAKTGDFKDIDFGKFVSKIIGNRKLIRTYYYNASVDQEKDPEKYRKQRQFFEKLRRIPNFKVTLVRLQKRIIDGQTSYAIKGDDIHLATDLIVLAYNNAYDTALIISGDADFIPAIKAVQEKGKQVENHYFRQGGSFQLRQECNHSVQITEELVNECRENRD